MEPLKNENQRGEIQYKESRCELRKSSTEEKKSKQRLAEKQNKKAKKGGGVRKSRKQSKNINNK